MIPHQAIQVSVMEDKEAVVIHLTALTQQVKNDYASSGPQDKGM